MTTIPCRDVRVGDILLHAGVGEVSKLIKWASDSEYSHVAMAYDANVLAEARTGGVHLNVALDVRVKDKGAASRIDAFRATAADPAPLPAADAAALRAAAFDLRHAEFAVNQLFELGVICVLKDKVPPDVEGRLFVAMILGALVRPDPDRLLCSEYVYLAFHNAKTTPQGKLDPALRVVKRHPTPFPQVDWWQLWKEYEHATGGSLLPLLGGAPGLRRAKDFSVAEMEAEFAALRPTLALSSRSGAGAAFAGSPLPNPNPEFILPQDLADSTSFVAQGEVVP